MLELKCLDVLTKSATKLKKFEALNTIIEETRQCYDIDSKP